MDANKETKGSGAGRRQEEEEGATGDRQEEVRGSKKRTLMQIKIRRRLREQEGIRRRTPSIVQNCSSDDEQMHANSGSISTSSEAVPPVQSLRVSSLQRGTQSVQSAGAYAIRGDQEVRRVRMGQGDGELSVVSATRSVTTTNTEQPIMVEAELAQPDVEVLQARMQARMQEQILQQQIESLEARIQELQSPPRTASVAAQGNNNHNNQQAQPILVQAQPMEDLQAQVAHLTAELEELRQRSSQEFTDERDRNRIFQQRTSTTVQEDEDVVSKKAGMTASQPQGTDGVLPEEGANKKERNRLLVMGFTGVLVVIAVAVSVPLTNRSGSDGSTVFVDTTPAPTVSMSPTEAPPTLETVVNSGVLRCGVTDKKGFSMVNVTTGQRSGFDIDLCRAVAAAVLGDPDAIEFTVLSESERFIALRDSEVDLLARETTHTMERETFEARKDSLVGFSFAAPYLYDGLGFGGVPEFVQCADLLSVFGECFLLNVCVLESTTHIEVLSLRLPMGSLTPVDSRASLYESFIEGVCNVIAADQFDVAEQVVRDSGYSGPYQVGANLFSREPLALVVRERDAQWYDFVNWVFQCLLIAEANDITRATAPFFPTTILFGDQFRDMFRNALGAVGNYGEIYARHLEPLLPRSGFNTLNTGDTGLIYSFPFGTLDLEGREPAGIIDTIVTRGQLRCGIIQRPGTGILVGNNQWNGADADYCRAVAAGLFATTTPGDVLEFVEVLDNANGLLALAGGEVDVFAGGAVTFERDVRDPGAGEGFTFTTPYFYYPTTLPPNSQYGETLSLVTVQDDTDWADFCFWIVHGTFFAAEQKFEQSLSNSMPQVQLFGRSFEDMLRNAIGAVGNWAEIYERSIQPILPMTNTSNQLNLSPVGPQLNPLPGLI